jgi:hypothetical protein
MKRLWIVFAVVLALATFTLLMIFVAPPEPTHGGKSLRRWADQYGTNNWIANRAVAQEAAFAIQQIGTNAIPFLLNLTKARDTGVKRNCARRFLTNGITNLDWRTPRERFEGPEQRLTRPQASS